MKVGSKKLLVHFRLQTFSAIKILHYMMIIVLLIKENYKPNFTTEKPYPLYHFKNRSYIK